MDTISNLAQMISIIPQIIILVAAIMLLSRRKGSAPVLIFIGALTSILTAIFFKFLLPVLLNFNIIEVSIYSPSVLTAINIFSTGAYICFAIGILLLVLEITKPQQSSIL